MKHLIYALTVALFTAAAAQSADERPKPEQKPKVERRAFLVTGDPQYLAEKSESPARLDPFSEEANQRFIKLVKSFPSTRIPEKFGGGRVAEDLLGVLVAGDLIDSADKNGGYYPAMQQFEWERYKADYGLTGKDGGLPFPVYELHGNHDGPQGDTFIIEGHTHGSPPSRLQWNGTQFARELPRGIDVFNPDDSGAAKTDPRNPGQAVGIKHGFLYVELIDREGDANDEFVVRSIATDDNWATHRWDQVWRKKVRIPE